MEIIKVTVDFLDNYGACCDAYPGCIATHKTLEGLRIAFAEVLDFHFEGMREDGESVPEFGTYELKFDLTIQALLNHYKGIISFSGLSKVTGINKQLLSHYVQGLKTPRPAQRKKIIEGLHAIGQELVSV